jgi:hypothetical protein
VSCAIGVRVEVAFLAAISIESLRYRSLSETYILPASVKEKCYAQFSLAKGNEGATAGV